MERVWNPVLPCKRLGLNEEGTPLAPGGPIPKVGARMVRLGYTAWHAHRGNKINSLIHEGCKIVSRCFVDEQQEKIAAPAICPGDKAVSSVGF